MEQLRQKEKEQADLEADSTPWTPGIAPQRTVFPRRGTLRDQRELQESEYSYYDEEDDQKDEDNTNIANNND